MTLFKKPESNSIQATKLYRIYSEFKGQQIHKCAHKLGSYLDNAKVGKRYSPIALSRPTSIYSHELARAAANAWSQITTSEQSRLYPPIWSLICPNPPLFSAPNPQQSLIPF